MGHCLATSPLTGSSFNSTQMANLSLALPCPLCPKKQPVPHNVPPMTPPPSTHISPASQPGLAHRSGLGTHSGLSPATVLSQKWVLGLPAPCVPVGGERPACWSHGAWNSLIEACRGLAWQHGQEVGRLDTWRPWASPSRNTHAQGSLNLFLCVF